ncbi:hypothetical protein CK203_080650 [Vitis vinifera]|uniref:Uncharacterized protein n=1 Tax=Vitis vinifera TaxID=29760 RepID=A0A438EZJ7_VITVI|nr:hypothetical protein CK203_080650 [Vitis vinifera]
METLDATSSCSSSASNLQSPSSKIPTTTTFCHPPMETSRAAKPPKPVVEISFLQTTMDFYCLKRKGSLNFMVRLVTEETREKTRDAVEKCNLKIYMPAMELGVLRDMPNIRKKACMKLLKQQGLHGSKLLSAYKDMVGTSNHDVLACQSSQTHVWLLVVELLSISCEEASQDNQYCCQMSCFESHSPVIRSNQQPDHEILQVYLTTWLAEVNIDTHRVDEIFAVIGEEMHVAFHEPAYMAKRREVLLQ